MSMKPKQMRKAVAKKKLVSQIMSMTMYISTVVPNIMLLTATPAWATRTAIPNNSLVRFRMSHSDSKCH